MLVCCFKNAIVLLTLAAAGRLCAQTNAARRFVPLVPVPSDTTAKCEKADDPTVQPGEIGYRLRFTTHGGVQRVVTAEWDSAGHLHRYGDTRGDADYRKPAAERGPRTSIMIEVERGVALLLNEAHGGSPGSLMSSVNDALSAENLGPPRKLLARLHTQCGAPVTVS